MKVFNIITSIVILLLAITSAVFSYFLYEKRVQFVDGWNQMSTAIQSSAKKIDEQGSKKYAPQLTVDKLSHKVYTQDGMKSQLTNLTKQSKEFVDQYNNAIAGWQTMTDAISKNAAEIEKYFPKGYSSKITQETLEFDSANYSQEDFDAKVKAIVDQNRAFVAEYNRVVRELKKTQGILANTNAELKKTQDNLTSMTADRNKWKSNFEITKRNLDQKTRDLAQRMGQISNMAKTLAMIGNSTGANTGTADDFQNLSTYQGRVAKVSIAVNNVLASRKKILETVERICGKKVDHNLACSDAVKGLRPLADVFNSHKNARREYAGAITAIGSRVKVSFKDNPEKNFVSTAAVIKANNTELAKIPQLQAQLTDAHRKIGEQKNTISARDKKISQLNTVIGDYKTILSLKPSDANPKAWDRGSKEARSHVVGSVTKVSEKYGYVVLDIGSDTKVIQAIGNKKQPINPDLESGLAFNVTRDGRFVAKVTLSTIGQKESTAHIPADKAGAIKVGDKVTFAEK